MSGWDPIGDINDAFSSAYSGLSRVFYSTVDAFVDASKKAFREAFRVIGVTGETIYATQVVYIKMIADRQKSFVQKIILEHSLNNTNLISNFLLSLNTGVHASIKKYLEYGKTDFINGLPTISNYVVGIPSGAVDAALTIEEGTAVFVNTSVYAYLAPNEWAKWWLQENTAFTYDNSQIIVGADTYQYAALVDAGTTYTASFNKIVGPGPLTYNVLGIPKEDDTKAYVIASYVLDSAPTLNKIWVYDRDSGVYPDLDPVEGSAAVNESTLPIVAIRKNFINLDDPSFAVEYESSRLLLKRLTINIDDIISEISENPDVSLIKDVFIFFGLNIYSESTPVIKALREFFTFLEAIQTTDKSTFDSWGGESNPLTNTFSTNEGSFNSATVFNYINTDIISGSIGNIGYVDSTVTILAPTPEIPVSDPDSDETYGDISQSYITYREQITATEYAVTVVHGLGMVTAVITTPGEAQIHVLVLEDIGGVGRDTFTIPLSLSTLTELIPVDQEQVLYEGLTLAVYAENSVELEYYETPGFAKKLQFIVLVVSVIFGPAGRTFGQVVANIITNIFYQYALTLVLKEILRHNLSDDERRTVFLLYSVAVIAGPNVTSFDFNKLTFADSLLAATNAVSTALLLDLGIQSKELSAQYEQFSAQDEERRKMLEEAYSRFSPVNGVDPLLLVKTFRPDPYEAPEAFYNRTVHIGNPGVLSLDQISTYHTKALELPRMS